jgi:signal transduction histidine kinase
MKKLCILGCGAITLFLGGCLLRQRFLTHELNVQMVRKHSSTMHLWEFADLRGEGYDYFLGSDRQPGNYQALYVTDLQGKVISQYNLGQSARVIKVLTDPNLQRPWIFVSFNDQRRVALVGVGYLWRIPLQREEKLFESIPRTDDRIDDPRVEWYANISPDLLEDIDGDGRLELVCRTFDAYTANPRGLVTYDFDSGRIKWRLDLTTSIYTLLFDDFDGDGTREFICSNAAFKNSTEVKQGVDDANGWLMVVSAKGEMLHREKVFDGYGEVLLEADDLDGDGRKEIYTQCITWGALNIPNSVNRLRWNGRSFTTHKSWKTEDNFEKTALRHFLFNLDRANTRRFMAVDQKEGLKVLDENLDPVPHRFGSFVKYIWDVSDLDRDGHKEILLQTTGDRFMILDDRFEIRAELKNPFRDKPDQVYARIVNTGYGKDPLIAIGNNTGISYYSYDRESPWILAYRAFLQASPYLSVFLALVILVILYSNWRRYRVACQAADSHREGIIVLSSKNKIFFCNRYAHSLVKSDLSVGRSHRLRNLRDCLPNLHAAVVNFIRSGSDQYSQVMALGEQKLEHTVHFFNPHHLRKIYLITLLPLQDTPATLNDKTAWADIARRLAHNVRRHITNIILALSPLQQEDKDDETREYAHLIRDEIEKIRVFTHAFQRFSELKDYELKAHDLIPSLEHCLAHTQIPAEVKLIKDWQLNSVEALIEPIRFEEVVSNLINNALEAMPDGGVLHLTVRRFPLHSGPRGDLSVLLEVEDSGRGIPEKYLEEVWKPFFTTKSSGTGIGLPESRKIIESMGGMVCIQSEEGKGTVVSVWLKGEVNGQDPHPAG